MNNLKFQKMWEAFGPGVYDIDTGSVRSLISVLPRIGSYADKYFLYYYDHKAGAAYYEKSEMEKAKAAGLKDFISPKYSSGYFKGVEDCINRIDNFIIELSNINKSELTLEDLNKLFQRGTNELVEIFGYYLLCQPQCVAGLEEELKLMLLNCVPEEKVDEIFVLLSSTTKISKIKQEEIDWLEILIKGKEMNVGVESEVVSDLLSLHHKKYFSLRIGDGQDETTIQEYKDKYIEDSKITIEDLKQKESSILDVIEKTKIQKLQAINDFKITEDMQMLANILSEIGHFRLEMRVSGWMPFYVSFCPIVFSEIEKRFNYTDNSLDFATIEEIEGILKEQKIDQSELDKRKEKFLMYLNNGLLEVYSGDKAEEMFNTLVEKEVHGEVSEIKGSIAMKGRATGRAVVFRWGDDMGNKINLMGTNGVLIAGQTRPQLMPLITKSIAIVTDEGGITSHAAIVSRELGIPCIIGTKIATQVLKDGDMVEVDADKGIVRVIT